MKMKVLQTICFMTKLDITRKNDNEVTIFRHDVMAYF